MGHEFMGGGRGGGEMAMDEAIVLRAVPRAQFKHGRRHKQVRLRFCSGEESRIAPIHKETRQ